VQDNEDPGSSSWSRLRRAIWVIVWASFLAACVATMIFFALFDPLLLGRDDQPPAWLHDRMTGYGVGFFFFWCECLVAAAITTVLLDDTVAEGLAAKREVRAGRS
jgi:hypothetical protein